MNEYSAGATKKPLSPGVEGRVEFGPTYGRWTSVDAMLPVTTTANLDETAPHALTLPYVSADLLNAARATCQRLEADLLRTRCAAVPKTIPQNAEPRPKKLIFDAVAMNVMNDASRCASS